MVACILEGVLLDRDGFNGLLRTVRVRVKVERRWRVEKCIFEGEVV